MRSTRIPVAVWMVACALWWASPARAFVAGSWTHQPLSTHKIFGNAKAVGNTLMLPGPAGAEIRSILLSSSSAAVGGLPTDAVIQKAYLFWSGSLAQNGVTGPKTADPTVTFYTANGSQHTVTGSCTTVTHPTQGTNFPRFYYCRADVSTIVSNNKLGNAYNGGYILGNASADPGHINPVSGNCTESPYPRCQAKYAAWSLVLIYSSPTETLQRDIHLYDGFRIHDHEDGPTGSLGVSNFTISGFLADSTPQGTLSYFAVETDAQLGMPPQNLSPPPATCSTCQDYVKFNGTTLSDSLGWPGNIFNESLGNGYGVDIDHIEVGNLLTGGATSASIEIGSGTGPVLNPPPSNGGGELFGLGWTLLTLRRPAPNFKTSATNKSVNPTQAGQGETLAYTINVTNAGSLAATNTVVTDTLPAQVNYKPGSLQVGGTPCTDAADSDPCTVSGKTITVNLGTVSHQVPNNSRQITFLSTVATSASNGQVVCNAAQVVSIQTPTPFSTAAACFTVKAPEINQPTKVDLDLDGGQREPEDIIQFTITIPRKSSGQISGISLQDDIPLYMQLLSVVGPTGAAVSTSTSGGSNGRGWVKVDNISIPAGVNSVSVVFTAQVDSVSELAAAGVPAGSVDGLQLCNQGTVSALWLSSTVQTDDPAASGSSDPTCFNLSYAPVLSSSNKSVIDLNGGKLEPGDTLRYNITWRNTGNRPATISATDDLPPHVTGFTWFGAKLPQASFTAGAGANGTGRVSVTNLTVQPGAANAVSVAFEVTITATVPNNVAIQNCVTFTVAEKANQGGTRCSPSLTTFATPDLETSAKAVVDLNGGNVQPGDTLRYTITVSNSGNKTATGVVVTDQVVTQLTSVAPLNGGSYNAATRTITWNVGAVAAGASVTRNFTAAVVTPTPNGTFLCNQGLVASAQLPTEPTNDPNTAQNDDATCVTVVSAPDLSAFTKAVTDLNGGQARPGDVLRYTLTVRNDGNESASNVVITDAVPAQLTGVSPLDGGTLSGGTITWSLGAMAPGQQRVVRFNATIVTPLVNGTLISNQASAGATQITPPVLSDDPATAALDDPTVVTVTSAATLGATKAVTDLNGGVPQPGDTLDYTITISNSGDSPARNTVITDVVAANLTTVTPQNGGSYNAVTRTITWPGTTVVPGVARTVHFRATLLFPLAGGTIVCNQGSVTSTDAAGTLLTDNPATPAVGDQTCVTVQSEPELSASTKAVQDLNGGQVVPGDTLRYVITVDNTGTANATSVVVTDVVATNLTAVTPQDGGVFNTSTRTITWTVGSVAAKSTTTLRFLAQVVLPLDDGTSISNQATVNAAGLSPVLTDDPATPATDDATVVTVSSSPIFSSSTKAVVDQNGGKAEPGDTLNYTLTITNSGTSAADNVVVTDLLDKNLTFVSAGQGGSYSSATRTLTWSGSTTPALVKQGVGSANSVTLTFSATINTPLANGTQVCNQGLLTSAEVTSAQKTDNPQTPALGDPTCLTISSAPDLSGVTKTVVDANGSPVRPGDPLTYTIAITNSGNSPATNVTVSDQIDLSLTSVSPGQGGQYNGATRTITWNATTTPALASVAAKSTVTVSFTATVIKPLDNGTSISNQATINSVDLPTPVKSDDPATGTIDDPTVVTVVAAPNLDGSEKIVTDTNGGDVEPGDTLTWTITLKNTGNALAKSVVVTDKVDTNLTNINPLDGGSYNAATRTITWNVAQLDLSPNGDVQLRFTAQVVSPLKNGTEIANQATAQVGSASYLTDNPSTAAVDDPTKVSVVSKPDLTGMTKTVSGAPPTKKVAPGTTLTYSIAVPNTGSEDAVNVTITDVVDTDLEAVTPLDGGSYNATTRTITWTVASIKVGATATLRFTAKVKVDAKNGDSVANQAFAEIAGTPGKIPSDDPTTPQGDDATLLTVEAIPDLEQFTKAVKDVNGGDPEPGDSLEYTLVVKNNGSSYAFDVKVTDQLQTKDLVNISVGQGGSYSSGTITWDATTTPALAKLAPGAQVTLTFSAAIRVPTNDGTIISNQALVAAAGVLSEPSDDPSTPQNDDATLIKVVSRPRLDESTKRVTDGNGGAVKPNDVLTYTIRVVNTGKSDAINTALTDPIPAYTSYMPGSTRLNGGPVADQGALSPVAKGMTINSPGLPAGRVTVGSSNAAVIVFQVRVKPETQKGTIISNQGLLSAKNSPVVPTDDPATPGVKGDPTQVVVGAGPNLNHTVKAYSPTPLGDNGNGKFDVGEVIAYKVTIPNTGTSAATGVVFTDPLDPAGRGTFVAGTLALDGTALTDGADGDAGAVVGNKLRVVVGSIAAGKAAVISYQVRISAGPQIRNQGTVRSTQLQPELTDADGNDANGDTITVVPVQGTPFRRLRGTKTALDVNGAEVKAGDEILYTITVYNDGNADETVDIHDHLPAGVNYVSGSLKVPPETKLSWSPPPGGLYQRGTLGLNLKQVKAGQSATVLFRARLDPTLVDGDSVCNTARLGGTSGLDLQPNLDPACVLLGSAVGTGGLSGTVFRDLGADNGKLDASDQLMTGFQVQAFAFGNPNGSPLATGSSDTKGVYQIAGLAPGVYTLRTLTSRGVQMGTLAAVTVLAGQAKSQDLPVDPSGLIYDSASGELQQAVQVFVHYDSTDTAAPGARVPESLLGQGQQGQVTDTSGFYRFDVPAGRKYELRLKPHSSSLQFPSALIPATPGFAKVGADNEVVAADTPDPKKEGADLTYYLRFDIAPKSAGIFNNHIPVDPLSSLIRLEKRSNRSRASVGDIVTYTISVQNRSTRAFTASGKRVAIEDVLPRGLRFLRRTARLMRRIGAKQACATGEQTAKDLDGSRLCLSRPTIAASATSARILYFKPIPMGAGESLRLVYQVAVGLDTRKGTYRNRAVLRDERLTSRLSNTAEARVLVVPDPDLDQGLLLGKVFCDHDKDGRQGKGEYGLNGARIYLDNGTYSVSDTAGKYHLRDIDPGLHLVKVDVNTLPAGSRLSTDESRVVQFTRGLPAKIDFGVVCKQNWVAVQEVKLPPKKKAKKKRPGLVVPDLSLAGNTSTMSLSVDGKVTPLLDVDLALTRGGRGGLKRDWGKQPAPRLRLDRRGRLSPRLVFHLRARNRATRAWRLSVWQLTAGRRQLLKRFSGSGKPPAQLLWDGTLAGKSVVSSGSICEAQLEGMGFSGDGATSPPRRFAVALTGSLGSSPRGTPSAWLDGSRLALNAKHRFATVIGRPKAKQPLLELRRGDGKAAWIALGPPPEEGEDEPLERIQVKGNLKTPKLSVDGNSVDLSLLRIGLTDKLGGKLAPLRADGQLKASAELSPSYTSVLIRKWRLRISAASKGRRVRTLGGPGKPPAVIRWDGLDDAGQPVVQPGESYLARLTLEDARGNLGRSAALALRAPAAVSLAPLELKGKRLFNLRTGAVGGRARRLLLKTLRLLGKRPAAERYRLNVRVAPPVTWESSRWASMIKAVRRSLIALLEKRGIKAARVDLTVGALPLPSAPVVPKKGRRHPRREKLKRLESLYLDAVPPAPVVPSNIEQMVGVDGEPIPVADDGSFTAWAKIKLGSAVILDLRDAQGRRALLVVPTKPRAVIPTSGLTPRSLPSRRVASAGPERVGKRTFKLTMRNGGTMELQLAQAPLAPPPATSQPAASQPAASQPAKPPTSQPAAPAASLPAAPPPASPAASADRRAAGAAAKQPFGADVLQKAFGLAAKARPRKQRLDRSKIQAAQLKVDLPPRGAVLKSHTLGLRGKTHPKNKVSINGAKVTLREDGSFSHVVKLPDGKSKVVIQATDPKGNRGIIRWPVEVSDRALFVMAMAEGAIGQIGAELEGDSEHTRVEAGPVMLHGRSVLYLKGRIKGKYLFKKYFITAHVDTAKQREFGDFFDQVVDPNRFYPIYGDSAEHVQDVNARDKYYLLVKADRSSLLVGNFRAGIKGVELLRYDRVLYGVKVDLDKKFFGGKLRQRAKAFVSHDDGRLTRDHNILRATGGSIYYLRHGQVLEGSERVRLVVRERDTGLQLSSMIKSRDVDYVIDYAGGRILFKSPVSSVADASFSVNNPAFTLSTLAGHPVYVEVDYEYESDGETGAGSWGVQVKDTLFDVLTLGATYVNENRNAQLGGDYRLYGGELTLRHGKASVLTAEFARSESYNASNFISEDGGITFLQMNHIAKLSGDERANDSNAYKIAGTLELSDFIKKVKSGAVRAQAYFSHQDRGFFSGGNILEQGRTKYGGRVDWTITDQDKITLRHDGAIALLPQMPIGNSNVDPLALREIETELSRLTYAMRRGRLQLAAEYAHGFYRDPTLVDLDTHRDTIGVLASYRIWKRLRVILGQDVIIGATGTDPQLGTGVPLGLRPVSGDDWGDRLMTTVGLAFGITKELEAQVLESVRWSGDNATTIGIKARFSKTASIYVKQIFGEMDERLNTTTVVGAEDRFGPKGAGKTYGEYQLQSGVLGHRNRAILGLAHKWTPWRGISFSGGYEHQQVFGGALPDGTPLGESQRDVVHVGFEYTRPRTLKLSGRAELRYDNGAGIAFGTGTSTAANVDSRTGLGRGYYADRVTTPGSTLMITAGERWQVVTRTAASWAATKDLTLMGRVNFYNTTNRTTDRIEAQALELGVGAALRPVKWDWLNVLIKYTRIMELRPISFTDDLSRWRTYDVVSVAPIVELPWRLQLVEKFAYKRVHEELDLLPGETLDTVVQTLLWINRINFHITGRLDAGVEYRFMTMMFDDQGSQLRHGALIEVGYWLHRFIRLGVGYNFSSFTDNEFSDQSRDAKGFFFRVVGRY